MFLYILLQSLCFSPSSLTNITPIGMGALQGQLKIYLPACGAFQQFDVFSVFIDPLETLSGFQALESTLSIQLLEDHKLMLFYNSRDMRQHLDWNTTSLFGTVHLSGRWVVSFFKDCIPLAAPLLLHPTFCWYLLMEYRLISSAPAHSTRTVHPDIVLDKVLPLTVVHHRGGYHK